MTDLNTRLQQSRDHMWRFAMAGLIYTASCHLFYQSWTKVSGLGFFANLSLAGIIYCSVKLGQHANDFEYTLKGKI